MPGIPPALETDTEDVSWALQTAEALWKRNERIDALVWLRRAAQAAGEAEHDDRALELANDAAELAEWIGSFASPTGASLSAFPLSKMRPLADAVNESRTTQIDESEDVSFEVTLESGPSLPRDRMDTPMLDDERFSPSPAQSGSSGHGSEPPPAAQPRAPRVPSAAEKHAGMLDPWAESEARARSSLHDDETPTRPASASRQRDADEVFTSAPAIAEARPGQSRRRSPPPLPPLDAVSAAAAGVTVGGAHAGPNASARSDRGLDLSNVDALSDLPDDAREAFASAAVVVELSRDEEISGFALALILAGVVDLAATIVDTPAQRMEVGEVIRARGTIEHIAPVRLVAASLRAKVATWDEHAVNEAFRTCPWVEGDLRAASDRLQALVGATMGPLGERLDPMLRAQVASKLTLRALSEHEVFAARGKPIPGLLVVGAGELELVGDDGAPDGTVLRAGDFLFPHEVLLAGVAPSTVRASKGGALVLFADRHAAQELLVTCPPLLEIFAGM
jgi:hypothetical protein